MAILNHLIEVIQTSIKSFKIMDISITLTIAYLSLGCYWIIDALKLFKKGDLLSPEEMFLSLVVLLVVTIFWPLIIPIYSIQAFKDKKVE